MRTLGRKFQFGEDPTVFFPERRALQGIENIYFVKSYASADNNRFELIQVELIFYFV